MCGLMACIVGRSRERSARRQLGIGLDALRHRGPDGCGSLTLQHAGSGKAILLGHRRLAILDTSNAATQPMSWQGRYALVYNGEIYNFRDLRESLLAEGVGFVSSGDTEVLLHGLIRHGPGFVERLIGIFAFVFVDSLAGTVVTARDPLGVKPLYRCENERGEFAFSSEVRAVSRSGFLGDQRIDPAAIGSFLRWGYVRGPSAALRGVISLPPGSYQEWSLEHARPRRSERYFKVLPSVEGSHLQRVDSGEARDAVREVVERSVSRNLVSDVPIGAFLSGGIDSSIVVAAAASVHERIVSVSLTFGEDSSKSEAAYARAVARRFGTEHIELEVRPEEFLRDQIEPFFDAMDLPTMDGVNSYVVSQAARKAGLTVVLSGTGGDELFGGYPAFRDVPAAIGRLRRLGPGGCIAGSVGQAAMRLFPRQGRVVRAGEYLAEAANGDCAGVYRARKCLFSSAACSDLLPGWSDLDVLPPDLPVQERIRRADPFDQISVMESSVYLRDCLLRDTDVFSMAHSLEVRVPLLDRDVVETAWRIPGAIKALSNGFPKPLLVSAFQDLLPREAYARPKQGFTFPFRDWLQSELRPMVEEELCGGAVTRLLRPQAVRRVWQNFLCSPDRVGWSRPWSLFVLSRWLRREGLA